jgi:hypothetical protein
MTVSHLLDGIRGEDTSRVNSLVVERVPGECCHVRIDLSLAVDARGRPGGYRSPMDTGDAPRQPGLLFVDSGDWIAVGEHFDYREATVGRLAHEGRLDLTPWS